MPSPQVHTDDKPQGIIPGIVACRTVKTQALAGTVAVASIKNLALIQPDGLTKARHLNIRHEGVKFLAFEERKNIGQWMKREIRHHISPIFRFASFFHGSEGQACVRDMRAVRGHWGMHPGQYIIRE
jgi:hypothetical protein